MSKWDTDKDYEIINMMKIFMGENEGRKAVFNIYAKNKFSMQTQHSIFDDFERSCGVNNSEVKFCNLTIPSWFIKTFSPEIGGAIKFFLCK